MLTTSVDMCILYQPTNRKPKSTMLGIMFGTNWQMCPAVIPQQLQHVLAQIYTLLEAMQVISVCSTTLPMTRGPSSHHHNRSVRMAVLWSTRAKYFSVVERQTGNFQAVSQHVRPMIPTAVDHLHCSAAQTAWWPCHDQDEVTKVTLNYKTLTAVDMLSDNTGYVVHYHHSDCYFKYLF